MAVTESLKWEVTRFETVRTPEAWVLRKGDPVDGYYWVAGGGAADPVVRAEKLSVDRKFNSPLAAKQAVTRALGRRRARWRETQWEAKDMEVAIDRIVPEAGLGEWRWFWRAVLFTSFMGDEIVVQGIERTYEKARERGFAAADRLQTIGPRLLIDTPLGRR